MGNIEVGSKEFIEKNKKEVLQLFPGRCRKSVRTTKRSLMK